MRQLALFSVIFVFLFSQDHCFSETYSDEVPEECDDEEPIYLSLNIDEGKRLVLSNGSTYEIAPIDQIYSAYWITPFPIMLSESGDPDYPVKITNMYTETFVRGKQLITSEVIEEERQKRLQENNKQDAKPELPQESIEPEEQPEPTTPDQKPQS